MADQPHDTQDSEALRRRLTRLSEASLRINETLDFYSVLHEVADSARQLTGARYGAITVFQEPGQNPDFFVSGLSREEHLGLWNMPEGIRLFNHLAGLQLPMRTSDLDAYVRENGLPEFHTPVPLTSMLVAPIRNAGVGVGTIYLAKSEEDQGFSPEDEETLVMFATQAAMVIANAARYREEKRARADLETLISTSPVGVIVFDARSGVPLSSNREAERILGALRMPGTSLKDSLEVISYRRADGREIALDEFPLARALSTGETVRSEEIVIHAPGGSSVTTLTNATPIMSDDGEVEKVVVTFQDLTPLEDVERLRADFLAMVSHELRSPLTSIKGSAVTLLGSMSTLDPAESAELVRIIDGQADRMRELINDLLDVARIETGNLSMVPQPSELSVLVGQAKSAFQGGGGRHTISVELHQGLPLVVADSRRIGQVLGNLLSNAATHSPQYSTIVISAELQEGMVQVSVADHGGGINAERIPNLFHKFSRLDLEGQGVGTGLGLAICRGIVEAHGGRIWAESGGLGKGARFTFTLPVVGAALDTDQRDGRSQAPALPLGSTDPLRVLVVDDDLQTLRYVRGVLLDAGFAPTITADPNEVHQLIAEKDPHLVLLDLMLPGTDGIALMSVIRQAADVPVVFLSAYGEDHIIARAFEMGASDYVVKPFSPTELVARIQSAVRRYPGPLATEPVEPFRFGDLEVDYDRRRVTIGGTMVDLTATEYRMLVELTINAGRVMTHENLLRRVWNQDKSKGSAPVRTVVRRLRSKLGDDGDAPSYILTRRRIGYWIPEPN